MFAAHPVAYNQLQNELANAGLELSVAEVHGLMCGIVCNQMSTGARPDLQRLLTAGTEVSAEALANLRDLLEDLLKDIVEKLYGTLGEFRLMLPGDDEGLSIRLQALADWCRGFSVGLMNNEAFAIDQLSPDSAEVTRDMMAVAEVEIGHSGEGDEWDFAEVEEFVRVGVQVIFEELRSAKISKDKGEIH